jgi:XTP/dITP diphosphohydrolase
MLTLLIATRNLHKVEEIRTILGVDFGYRTMADFPEAPQTVEDAGTFAGNAAKKAVELANWVAKLRDTQIRNSQPSRLYVLADDSGLEVDALGGAPGVHSARFAALDTGQPRNSSTAENNAKLLRLLQRVPAAARTARFRCVLALTPVVRRESQGASPTCNASEPELLTELFEGTCEGQIISAPSGQGGFGYDPLFVPKGYNQTFGQLAEQTKNQLSHRAKALAKLRKHLAERSQTSSQKLQ